MLELSFFVIEVIVARLSYLDFLPSLCSRGCVILLHVSLFIILDMVYLLSSKILCTACCIFVLIWSCVLPAEFFPILSLS